MELYDKRVMGHIPKKVGNIDKSVTKIEHCYVYTHQQGIQ
jgi:hypothetical protein